MPISYKDAGVDIDAGDELVERIKPLARSVRTSDVIDDVGGFAGLCSIPSDIADPVLVSGTDGVGTKLELAFATSIHDTIGIDLVAMCVNDIVTVGARPLFFLDYFASGKLNVEAAHQVIKGITEGCRQAHCALLGGETAELPGMYASGVYDLAGFAVGVVSRSKIINGKSIVDGDQVVAVASTGLHSNGYSLARMVASRAVAGDWSSQVDALDGPIGKVLLTPTRIYADAVASVIAALDRDVHGIVHITGGGLPGNVPRVLPDGLGVRLHLESFTRPAIFDWIAAKGPVEESEMQRTFNLGVGMCFIVPAPRVEQTISALQAAGESAWHFGSVIRVDPATPFEQRVVFA